jgi:hypothetical protein
MREAYKIVAEPYTRYWLWVGFATLFSILVFVIMVFGALVAIMKWQNLDSILNENKYLVLGAMLFSTSLIGLWIIWKYEWNGKYWILNDTELCKGRNGIFCINLYDIVEINIGLPQPEGTARFWERIGKIFAKNQFALVKNLRDNAVVLRLADRSLIILQILDLKNAAILLERLLYLKSRVVNQSIRYSNLEKRRLILRNANKLLNPQ